MHRSLYITLQVVVCLFLATISVSAERINRFSASIGFGGGIDSNPRVGSTNFFYSSEQQKTTPYYGVQPAFHLTSTGTRSVFEIDYSLSINRYESDLDLHAQSHRAGASFTIDVNPGLKLGFANTFVHSPDFSTAMLYRDSAFTLDAVFRDPETIAVRRDSWANTVGMSAEQVISPVSRIILVAGHYMRRFDSFEDPTTVSEPVFQTDTTASQPAIIAPRPLVLLTNQNHLYTSARYQRQLDDRTFLSGGYSFYRYDFEDFADTYNHNGEVGITRIVNPTVAVSAMGGPSHSRRSNAAEGRSGLGGAFVVSKSFEEDQLSVSYSRRHAGVTGLSSVSNTQSAGVFYAKRLRRTAHFNSSVAVYQALPRNDNPIDIRGVSATTAMRFLLNPSWALSFGGAYRSQKGSDVVDLERYRIFVSLRVLLRDIARF
jgi:hypothetical protein